MMNINESIRLAFRHQQSGDLQEAVHICKKILKRERNNVKVLHLLGTVYYQLGRYDFAEHCIEKVLQISPNDAEAHNNFGLILQAVGNLDKAIACFKKALKLAPNLADVYFNLGNIFKEKRNLDEAGLYFRKAVQIDPNYAYAYNNLGLILIDTGNLDEAIVCFQKALQLDPALANTYFNLGLSLKKTGRLDEAITCFAKALKINPQYAEAYNNLGVSLKEKGQLDKAIACFERALQVNPQYAEAHNNLGTSFLEEGAFDKAIACFERALQVNPNFSEVCNNLGVSFQGKGQLSVAVSYFQRALQIAPEFADAYNNLGLSFQENGKDDEAMALYQKAIQLNPNFANAYNNLGIAYINKGQISEAIDSYQKALQFNPKLYAVFSNLGCVLKDKGMIDEAENLLRRAVHATPDAASAYSNLLLTMQYNSKNDARTIYLEHIVFSEKYEKPLFPAITPHANDHASYRKLKIGYLSPDFRRHSVSYFLEAALIHRNREDFEIFCYANSLKHDEVTERIQRFTDQWRSIVGISDEEAVELIRNDEIDILIDLAGHTASNRILIFARKPAPIQMSWIGYPSTTGLSAIDYKIVDNYTDPPGMTEELYSETLIRLPESFLCYLPDEDSPEVGNLPLSIQGHITFGSFNYYSKVSSVVLDIWIKILQSIPNSHLVMKAKSLADGSTRQHIAGIFEQHDISVDRIELLSWAPSTREHLELYNSIDIGLDTFPYNGTTTTCEAMWMGVPVITLAGNMHASRVGVSLLSNVGLKYLIAETSDEYIDIAVKLANDTARLQSLREGLREMMKHSPLCDAKKFTANLEKCYREVWEKWRNSV